MSGGEGAEKEPDFLPLKLGPKDGLGICFFQCAGGAFASMAVIEAEDFIQRYAEFSV